MNPIWKILFVFGLLSLLLLGGTRTVHSIQFEKDCEGYLKLAADANTIDLAEQNLAKAVGYLKERNMTSGNTSVFYKTPNQDIGFWYKNLASALQELRKVDPNATSLEKTNILMKLRETLLDEGGGGVSVTVPPDISIFPLNRVFAGWSFFSILFLTPAVLLFFLHRHY